jgi:hypothetical protein
MNRIPRAVWQIILLLLVQIISVYATIMIAGTGLRAYADVTPAPPMVGIAQGVAQMYVFAAPTLFLLAVLMAFRSALLDGWREAALSPRIFAALLLASGLPSVVEMLIFGVLL